jgi:mRNA-degrading endonuclease RelE of RelBE toxin-antitoxin system
MAKKLPFTLIFRKAFASHLDVIEPKYYSQIRDTIKEQLTFEPDVPTTNRKPLLRPGVEGADWEIRFGPSNKFRVFYQMDLQKHEVYVLAIGIKLGNRLIVGGEEFKS